MVVHAKHLWSVRGSSKWDGHRLREPRRLVQKSVGTLKGRDKGCDRVSEEVMERDERWCLNFRHCVLSIYCFELIFIWSFIHSSVHECVVVLLRYWALIRPHHTRAHAFIQGSLSAGVGCLDDVTVLVCRGVLAPQSKSTRRYFTSVHDKLN